MERVESRIVQPSAPACAVPLGSGSGFAPGGSLYCFCSNTWSVPCEKQFYSVFFREVKGDLEERDRLVRRVLVAWRGSEIREQKSEIKDQRSKIRDQRSKFKDQRSNRLERSAARARRGRRPRRCTPEREIKYHSILAVFFHPGENYAKTCLEKDFESLKIEHSAQSLFALSTKFTSHSILHTSKRVSAQEKLLRRRELFRSRDSVFRESHLLVLAVLGSLELRRRARSGGGHHVCESTDFSTIRKNPQD